MKKLCGLMTFEDEEHWKKFVITVGLAFAVFNNGWFYGLLGPSLPDLQVLTNTDLQQVSTLLTTQAIGRIVGALVVGYLCDRTRSVLLLLVLVTCFGGLATAALPWSHFYGVFLAVIACCGFGVGGINCAAKVKLAVTWQTGGASYFQLVNFAYALGGILAPLVATPFFEEPYQQLLDLTNSSKSNNTNTTGDLVQLDGVESGQNSKTNQEGNNVTNASYLQDSVVLGVSRIEIPYAITGGLYLSASFGVLLLLCIYSDRYPSEATKEEHLDKGGNSHMLKPLPTGQLCFFLCIIFLILVCSTSVEFIHQAYLMTFAIRQMKWTRSMGAVLTSSMWATFGFGRLLGIFVARKISPASMVYISFSGMFLMSFAQFGGGYFRIDSLTWVSVPLTGLAMSVFAPSLSVWINENVIVMTGKIASFIICTTSVAMLTFPLYLGYLIDKVSPMWFVYVQPLDCLASLLLFTVLVVGVNRSRKHLADVDPENKPLLGNESIQ